MVAVNGRAVRAKVVGDRASVEVLGADSRHQREADGRVDAVTATHPIPELEHVRRVDAEFSNSLRVGRDRHEMAFNSLFISQAIQ